MGHNPGLSGSGVPVQRERFLLSPRQAPVKAGGCNVREVCCSCVVLTSSPMAQASAGFRVCVCPVIRQVLCVAPL